MTTTPLASIQPTAGFDFSFKENLYVNRTGATSVLGDLARVDLDLSDADSTNYREGDSGSAFANVVVPAATDRSTGIFVVCAQAGIADNELVKYVLWGRDVLVQMDNKIAADQTVGAELWAPAAAALDAVHITAAPGAGAKRLGFVGENATVTASSVQVRNAGAFNGWGKAFGSHFI